MSPVQLSVGSAEWLLAFADDEHLIGARHAEWIGLGPFLEEDLAFCSIAQDELGHAIALYDLLTDDVDRYALLRSPEEFRSAWLCEAPCNEWDRALVRHWLYDRAEALRWETAAASSLEPLRALAARAEREEAFHREHAEMFLSRITAQDTVGRSRITAAIDALLPLAVALWEPVAGEAEALSDGVAGVASETLGNQWANLVQADVARWGLDITWPDPASGQNARTQRSSDFAALHAALRSVIDIEPSAAW